MDGVKEEEESERFLTKRNLIQHYSIESIPKY